MTLITGHRGARNLWPENSLTGFRNAITLGVDAIEFDVHLTRSGELVVIHDATLERTAEGAGPVQDLSVEARKATLLKGTDEAIPTLADVLGVLAANKGIDLHVEIKIDETGTPYPDIAARVAAELSRFGVGERSYLTSFDTSVLEDCRLHAADVSRLVSVNAVWKAGRACRLHRPRGRTGGDHRHPSRADGSGMGPDPQPAADGTALRLDPQRRARHPPLAGTRHRQLDLGQPGSGAETACRHRSVSYGFASSP
ncbi:glycerophosphoryl diester phosphodiesterase [Rhizobium sp. BK379]|nr:glycerophosphoryl diester phosphodiesterase [Rhizobium sp. BK379]